jgi:hypothetical protein
MERFLCQGPRGVLRFRRDAPSLAGIQAAHHGVRVQLAEWEVEDKVAKTHLLVSVGMRK